MSTGFCGGTNGTFRDLGAPPHGAFQKCRRSHLVVTIQPFPLEMDELMERMWTELWDRVERRAGGHRGRTMHFERVLSHTRAKKPVVVEIWQDESGEFHYVEGAGTPAGR
jgi:hypothetical protein